MTFEILGYFGFLIAGAILPEIATLFGGQGTSNNALRILSMISTGLISAYFIF